MTRISAIYRNGVFVPEFELPLANETAVELVIAESDTPQTTVLSDAEKAKLRQRATSFMKQHRLSPEAPRFSRDDLHERR